jgi:hypothetical protein
METAASFEVRNAPSSYPTVVTGDSGREAYTAIAWGVGLSHERSDIAEAESFYSLEGNMCGTVMRGADALPGSKATSRAKGSHRKLGDLGSDRNGVAVAGPHRKGEERAARLAAILVGESPTSIGVQSML